MYLEVIDYQLFVVNTVEKWIGSYLWVYGKWRFNDFNLLLHANVRFGWQNEGRKRNGKGCRERKDGVIVVTSSWYIDFSFECSIVVRPASCLRGSPWRQCQPLDIYQAMLSNSFWIHCSSKWCQQNVSRCRGWRIFDRALHYCSPMESMVLSWWEFEERANGSKDEHDDNRNFVSKSPLSSTT